MPSPALSSRSHFVRARLTSFLAERFPFALAVVREVADACGADRLTDREIADHTIRWMQANLKTFTCRTCGEGSLQTEGIVVFLLSVRQPIGRASDPIGKSCVFADCDRCGAVVLFDARRIGLPL